MVNFFGFAEGFFFDDADPAAGAFFAANFAFVGVFVAVVLVVARGDDTEGTVGVDALLTALLMSPPGPASCANFSFLRGRPGPLCFSGVGLFTALDVLLAAALLLSSAGGSFLFRPFLVGGFLSGAVADGSLVGFTGDEDEGGAGCGGCDADDIVDGADDGEEEDAVTSLVFGGFFATGWDFGPMVEVWRNQWAIRVRAECKGDTGATEGSKGNDGSIPWED